MQSRNEIGPASRLEFRQNPQHETAVTRGKSPLEGKQMKARRTAFTLIELLIVVLILAILMAVSLPLYLGVASDSQLKVCRANMQTLADAEAAYRTQTPSHTFTTVMSN